MVPLHTFKNCLSLLGFFFLAKLFANTFLKQFSPYEGCFFTSSALNSYYPQLNGLNVVKNTTHFCDSLRFLAAFAQWQVPLRYGTSENKEKAREPNEHGVIKVPTHGRHDKINITSHFSFFLSFFFLAVFVFVCPLHTHTRALKDCPFSAHLCLARPNKAFPLAFALSLLRHTCMTLQPRWCTLRFRTKATKKLCAHAPLPNRAEKWSKFLRVSPAAPPFKANPAATHLTSWAQEREVERKFFNFHQRKSYV